MVSRKPLATLLLLGGLPLCGPAIAQDGATDGRAPATTQTAPAQPYGPGSTPRPSTATTTDGSGVGRRDTTRDGLPADRTAGSSSEAVPPMFKELDQNQDGYITREEAKRSADTTARFSEMDTDRDGRISLAEWKAAADRKSAR